MNGLFTELYEFEKEMKELEIRNKEKENLAKSFIEQMIEQGFTIKEIQKFPTMLEKEIDKLFAESFIKSNKWFCINVVVDTKWAIN